MYRFEFVPGAVLLAAVVVLPLAPAFAMIALLLVALAAVTAVVALTAAIIAAPFLLVRHFRARLAERGEATEVSGSVAKVIEHAESATEQAGFAALAHAAAARGSR
jgi:positive regulator of sigma E activity